MTRNAHVRAAARLAVAALGLLGLIALAPATADAQLLAPRHPRLCWTDFDTADPGSGRLIHAAPRPLPDGDRITVRREYAFPGQDRVEFVFQAGPQVTWWKQLRIEARNFFYAGGVTFTDGVESPPDWTGPYIVRLETQDHNRGPHATALRASRMDRVVFAKAKFLGIHTDMYELADKPGCTIGSLAGQRITFTWTRD